MDNNLSEKTITTYNDFILHLLNCKKDIKLEKSSEKSIIKYKRSFKELNFSLLLVIDFSDNENFIVSIFFDNNEELTKYMNYSFSNKTYRPLIKKALEQIVDSFFNIEELIRIDENSSIIN